MGACDFYTVSKGATAREAFDAAVERARYDRGHGGYTGTIAEKSSFVAIDVPEDEVPGPYARRLLRSASDPRIDDKWGPAGCIRLGPDEWLFFGWASS